MEVILQIFYSIFSGVLLAIAIPNEIYLFGAPIITLFALIPYYKVFQKINNYRKAFLMGFLQALSTHLVSSFWLAYFKDFAIFTLGASALGTACIGGFLGLFFYLPYSQSSYHNKLNEKRLNINWQNSISFRILYFAFVYTLYEWVKSSGFIGYPWGTVSSAMFKWPILMQISSVTGTYGVTFIICIANALLYELFEYFFHADFNTVSINSLSQFKDSTQSFYLKQVAIFFYFLLIPTLLFGIYEYGKIRKPIKTLSTILVQQNSDPWKETSDSQSILNSQKLTQEKINELQENNSKAELVVWSEGCLKHAFPRSQNTYQYLPYESPLIPFIESTKTPFIIGGSYVRNSELRQYFNAAILFDEDGNFRGVYGKNHLVPFAEALPFIEIPFVYNFMESVIGISAGWTPGDQYVFFEIPCKTTNHYKLPSVKNINLNQEYKIQKHNDDLPPTVKIATPICFDDAFTDIMRPLFLNGAELFVNITDDSWSLKKSSEIQHFCIAAYKAIEYRTTLVRSANAGYSVVVAPNGKVIADLPLFEQSSLAYDVPIYERKMTTYARFGNWLPYLSLILVLLFAVYSNITFTEWDYIPSERKIKKSKKKSKNKKKK